MQEVIVYRNPMEAAMWHALGSGELLPIICGIVLFFIVFLSCHAVLVGRRGQYRRRGATLTHVSLAIGVVSGIALVVYMLGKL